MNFQHYDLKNVSAGSVVEVTLDSAANVQILDNFNFSNYKNRRNYKYIGGYVTQSPYTATIPNSGHWHVVVDLGGHAGTVRSSVRVLPGI